MKEKLYILTIRDASKKWMPVAYRIQIKAKSLAEAKRKVLKK